VSGGRLSRFEEHRYVGDKRTQLVYDQDDPDVDRDALADIAANETGLCFAPDTLPEARNRGYRLAR
jgi:hypothetical protein